MSDDVVIGVTDRLRAHLIARIAAEPESKSLLRRVRDAAYWRRPAGTPISPGDHGHGVAHRADMINAVASADPNTISRWITGDPNLPDTSEAEQRERFQRAHHALTHGDLSATGRLAQVDRWVSGDPTLDTPEEERRARLLKRAKEMGIPEDVQRRLGLMP